MLPEGLVLQEGSGTSSSHLRDVWLPLQEETVSLGRGQSLGQEAYEPALPFTWAPGILRVHRWSSPSPQGRQPQRAWSQGAAVQSAALPDCVFCASAGDRESCLACVVG